VSFLTIIEDDQTFEYSPLEPSTGERMDSVFVLRVLPDAELKKIRARCIRTVWEQHQRIEKMDDHQYSAEIVEYAIVDWRGVKSARSEKDLPCTSEMKARLPSVVKGDIIRLCGAKEADAHTVQSAQEKKPSKPTSTLSKVS